MERIEATSDTDTISHANVVGKFSLERRELVAQQVQATRGNASHCHREFRESSSYAARRSRKGTVTLFTPRCVRDGLRDESSIGRLFYDILHDAAVGVPCPVLQEPTVRTLGEKFCLLRHLN